MLDLSANERPLPLKQRPDVLSIPRLTPRGRQWICKDPVRRRYYALTESEHQLWQMLDGRTSIAQIKDRYACLFEPRRLETASLVAFLARLYRQELVVALSPGQGVQLASRARSRRFQERATLPLQLLAWRFRGFDPDPLLDKLAPFTKWLFSRWCCWILIFIVAAAVGIAFSSSTALIAEAPALTDFFRAENLLLLGLTLSVVKILHEFGHALTCKYLGGEVRELGLMFLFFSPCLYCDVSDAWLFPQRRQRMAVSAAGMIVEVCLAAIATLIWSLTQPGLTHHLCLNVMFVCGISTLLINGNPLMRYDGYYLLSDAIDLPNLDERARGRLQRLFANLVLGIALPRETPSQETHSGLVLCYAVLSTIYRAMLLVSILWMLHAVLHPLRLEVFVILAAILCLAGVVAVPLWQSIQQMRNPLFWQRVSPTQVAVRLTIIGALLAGLIFTPLPCRVSGPGVVESSKTQSLYATTPGNVSMSLSAGTLVRPGQTVVQLDNPEARLALARVEAEAARLKVRLQSLETLRGVDPDVASEIPAAQELLQDVERQVTQHQQELSRLNLVSNQSGQVIEPLWRRPGGNEDEQLEQWGESPLAAYNRGARIETGTMLVQVVDPKNLEVQLLLDQSSISLVSNGQRAFVSLWQSPGQIINGTVIEVSRMTIDEIPAALKASGDILTQRTAGGHEAALSDHYQVRIQLKDVPAQPVLGGRCTARISVAPQSIASRLSRYFRQTFGRS